MLCRAGYSKDAEHVLRQAIVADFKFNVHASVLLAGVLIGTGLCITYRKCIRKCVCPKFLATVGARIAVKSFVKVRRWFKIVTTTKSNEAATSSLGILCYNC